MKKKHRSIKEAHPQGHPEEEPLQLPFLRVQGRQRLLPLGLREQPHPQRAVGVAARRPLPLRLGGLLEVPLLCVGVVGGFKL